MELKRQEDDFEEMSLEIGVGTKWKKNRACWNAPVKELRVESKTASAGRSPLLLLGYASTAFILDLKKKKGKTIKSNQDGFSTQRFSR